MEDPTVEIYDKIGSDAPFYALVEAFYVGVETDPILRPMYPADLSSGKDHLALFLIQRFGGHTTYGDQRGHPRLRIRHVPFAIGQKERDAWVTHMLAAVDSVTEFQPFREALRQYFTDSADFLVNRDG